MNIDDLTIKEAREISLIFQATKNPANSLNRMLGKKVIIRTYSAGVWFGILAEKNKNEVILEDARRMWRWHAQSSISLSSCANNGVIHSKSKIAEPVESVWLEAIEIIPCTKKSIDSLEGAANAIAE